MNKEQIIDNLTPEQEALLRDEHMQGYIGTDDDAPDDFENWLMELSEEELKEIIKMN